MTNKSFCGRSALFAAAWVALSAGLVACGSDSNGTSPDGGTGGEGTGGAGTGGKASGGSAGKGSGGTTASGGTTGSGGAKGGSGGTSTGGSGGTSTGGTGGSDKLDAGGDIGDGCVPTESFTVPSVPDAIKLPVSDERLLHHFHARGTQDYKCTSSGGASPTYSWVSTPEAFLYDSCNDKVIQHSAGPTWTWLADGSAIKGTKVAGSDVSGSIQQLLLSAVSTGNTGELSEVNYVQRLDTSGGAAPAAGDCTASNVDEVRKVQYQATYYFYVPGSRDGGADADSGKP
jgi:hypothetical protein